MPRKKVEDRPDGKVVQVDIDTEERAYAAHKLRLQGYDWTTVAEMAGYANDASAKVNVRAYLQRAAADLAEEHRQEALAEETARLNELQAAIWPKALDGDLKAVDSCVRIIMSRAKLRGLDTPSDERVTNNTVVVTAERFAETLKGIALGEITG